MRKPTGNPGTEREQQARDRARRVHARVLRGESPSAAAQKEHTDLRTVWKYTGAPLRQSKADQLSREMFVITPLGPQVIAVRGSRAASLLGKHAAAVQHFLRSGDSSRLAQFKAERIAGHELIVDTTLLTKLAEAGVLRLDNLYSTPKTAS